jgi:Zn-dependent metalloprotease
MPTLTPPSATAGLSSARLRQLGRLAASSAVPVSVSVAKANGPITDLRGQFRIGRRRFLQKAAPGLGLPKSLAGLAHVSSEKLGTEGTRVMFGQSTRAGLLIFGAGVAVDMDAVGSVVAVTARLSTAKLDATSTMDAVAAAEAIARHIGMPASTPSAPELVVVDPGVLIGESKPPFLGWRSSVDGEAGSVVIVVPDGGGVPVVVQPGGGGGWEPVPRYHVNDATGTPDFVTFAPFGLVLPEVASGSPTAVALALFTRYPLLFGTGDVSNQLRVLDVSTDAGPQPMSHVRLQQIYAGVPVFGAELRVHLTPTLTVMSVSGNYLRNPAIAMDVVVNKDTARRTAINNIAAAQLASTAAFDRPLRRPKPVGPILNELEMLGTSATLSTVSMSRAWQVVNDRKAEVVDAGLEILPGVLADTHVENHLTWRFRFTESDLFVSATTGDVVFAVPNLLGARRVFDGLAASPISLAAPSLILVDGANVAPTPPGNGDIMPADSEAAGAVGFWALLARNGWDGAGANTDAVTNAAFPFPNAMWVIIRNQMWFSPGFVRPDVVAHEFTHGVTASTAGLLYIDESGALNEHYSDIMGNLAAPDAPPTSWFIGETGAGGAGALRDMKSPAVGNYAAYVRRTGACTAVLAPLTMPVCDAGGVHTNSGIGNRAAVLLCDGDGTAAHSGIGRSRLGRLFADTLTTRLHPWSRYLDELHNTWEVARDLSRRGVVPAALPATAGTQPAFAAPFVQDEVVWAFTQVGVDRRLMTGWFEVGGGLSGGRGTTTFNAGQMLPTGFVVGDVDLVVRAIEPTTGQRYWEGRSLVSAGGAVTFPGGVFGAAVVSHGVGTPDETVGVRWFHSGFLPLEITVNIIPATAPGGPPAVVPAQIEAVSAAMVHWGGLGGKGDETVNAGMSVTGTGCTITDVILELLDRNYQVQSSHRMGQTDATYGGTGARITSQNLGTANAAVGVHWWYDLGWACRYQLRYLISGTNCSL